MYYMGMTGMHRYSIPPGLSLALQRYLGMFPGIRHRLHSKMGTVRESPWRVGIQHLQQRILEQTLELVLSVGVLSGASRHTHIW